MEPAENLTRDCPHCLGVRKVLEKLQTTLWSSCLHLSATPLSGGNEGKAVELIKGSLGLRCDTCGDHLLILSDEGERLMSLFHHQNGMKLKP